MRPLVFSIAAALLVLTTFGRALVAAEQAKKNEAKGLEFFEKKIRPVLAAKCYKCHAADSKEIKGKLVVDTRDGIRKGGESGPAVVPGSVGDSLLIEALRYESFEMPPDAQLPDEVIADFVKWVEMGAPDPRDGAVVKIQKEIDFEKGRQFWAFQPVKKVEPPQPKHADWARDDVDRFLLARIEAEGLHPVADAQPRALIRRLYFDLVGLPPSPEEVERFAADPSPQALAEIVDRLLDSPQYGERWGRHWLDVARFAESNGRERNFLFPHAWRYRDYVIDAFNSDKPFDRFITEQIAGDLLPAKDNAERNEQLVATGFLAIGAKLLNERNREAFRMDMVDEQLDVTTRSFMALTVACARCHDHKFDPIPTGEYYAMAGIFRSSSTLYGTGGKGNRQGGGLMTLHSEKETKGKGAATDAAGDKSSGQKVADKVSDDKTAGAGNTDKTNTDKAADADELIKQRRAIQKQIRKLTGGAAKANKKKVARLSADDKAKLAELRARVKEINGQLAKQGKTPAAAVKQVLAAAGQKAPAAAGKKAPEGDLAMGVEEGDVEDCPLYIRGEIDDPGQRVPRGFLTIVTTGDAPQIAKDESGRLELARWIADPSNPLTARVIVNRVWQHLFGRGLVPTVDNFGANGQPPSHPELLDYLAAEFVADGWSVKRLIRRLVLTHTYSLASDYDNANYEHDPDNVLLWRMPPRRLDAEAIRDAMLAVSGQLDLARPEASPIAAYSDSQQVGRGLNVADLEAKSSHRSVYLPIVRNGVPPSLQVFDFAEPSIIVGSREVTTVPAQALYMMNSRFVIEQSDRMARRLLEETKLDDAARIDLAYRLAVSRPATDEERERAEQFIAHIAESLSSDESKSEQSRATAWAGFCQALLASAEFRYLD